MTMMARKRSPIPRPADDYSREAAAMRIDFAGTATGARPAQVREVMRTTPEQLFRECLELLGCYGAGKVRKLAGEWAGAHERLGRDRAALRGFNSEKEASWTG